MASIFIIGITLLFLDFTGTLHHWLGWMAKIQFLPAIFAANLVVFTMLVALTLVFGRVYCSVICPLGVMQDVISWISGKRKKKSHRFSYSPAISWLRYSVLALFIAAIIFGIGGFVALLAPYSAYGRIASNLFAPVYDWGNNLLALIAERVDSYAFYEKEVWIRSISVFVTAAVTFIILFILAWRNGRTYCNTICPVGTLLSFLSRFSLFRPVIDVSKCVNCGLCARKCKASCIDSKNHVIDYSRCVTCFDCIESCSQGALSYKLWKNRTQSAKKSEKQEVAKTQGPLDASRRNFLTASGLAIGSAIAIAKEDNIDGGLAMILDKEAPARKCPIVPPGAIGLRNMATHCTACQLCVSACPNGVLRPLTKPETFMQPVSSYERGYCRPECTECSQVCPTGAIRTITVAEKTSIQVGHAVWIRENCIPATDGISCGNCARHCPTGAIQMIPIDSNNPDSVKIPAVDTARCIGCGACENLCPARPFSAIYVEGNVMHHIV